jgi:U3 small nucleolar RNA-associated protein 14
MLHKSRELSKKVAVETDSSGAEESDGDEVPPANNSGTTSEKSDGSKANPWMTAGLRISKKAKTTSYSKPKALQNSSMVESDSDKSCDNETVEVISSKQAAKEVVSLTETDQEVNIDSLFDTLEGKNIPTIRQMKHQKYKENISIEAEDSDEEEDEIKEEAVSLDEELMSTDHGNSSIKMSLKRKKTMEDFEVKDDDDDDEDELKESVPSDAEEAVSQEKEEKSVAKVEEPSSTDDKALSVDPNQFMTLEGRRHKVLLAEEDDSEEEEMDNQSLTIAQAFATDDVIDEFSTEKRSIEERDKPKNVSMVLPGWGEWGGEGVQVSNRKKKR